MFKMTIAQPDEELINASVAKLAAAYNNRAVNEALTMFVDEGLEYSDYGTSLTATSFRPSSPIISKFKH